jgi:hypothetical protein
MKIALQISGQQRYGTYFAALLASLSIFDQVDLYQHQMTGIGITTQESCVAKTVNTPIRWSINDPSWAGTADDHLSNHPLLSGKEPMAG